MAQTPVGIIVQEGVANGLTPFQDTAKHNIGLLMERERGIPNKAVKVTSLQEDRLKFGGLDGNYGAYVTRHIYKNANEFGATIYGVRLLGSASLAATGTLANGSISLVVGITITVPAGVGNGEIKRWDITSFEVGDSIQLVEGSDVGATHVVAAGETQEDIVNSLFTQTQAAITTFPATWGLYTTQKIPGGSGVVLDIEAIASGTTVNVLTNIVDANPPADVMTLWAGQKGYKDPGTWANMTPDASGVFTKAYPIGHVSGSADKLVLEVWYNSQRVESWEASDCAELLAKLNEESNFIFAVSINTALTINTVVTTNLDSGTYVAPVEADFLSDPAGVDGLSILDDQDVQIVANAEHFSSAVGTDGSTYCLGHDNRPVWVGCLPYLASEATVETYANLLQTNLTHCGAFYNFWVKTGDENGSNVWVPPIGVVIGAGFIRVPGLNRDFIHTPPGGIDSSFTDVVDIVPRELSRATQTLYVKRYSTNIAIFKQGYGFFLFSSRTMSTNSLYHSIHIRRLTSYYAKQLESNLLWVVQKPNDPELQRAVYVSVFNYFLGEYQNGALERSVSFEEAAVLDVQTDPQDRKLLKIIIEYIPTEQVESIRIELNRNDGSLITNFS
jgi:hypothetical protein